VLEYPSRAPVAQLDRASDFESAGRPFESGQARSPFLPIFPEKISLSAHLDRTSEVSHISLLFCRFRPLYCTITAQAKTP
jgi:hypothetical protein